MKVCAIHEGETVRRKTYMRKCATCEMMEMHDAAADDGIVTMRTAQRRHGVCAFDRSRARAVWSTLCTRKKASACYAQHRLLRSPRSSPWTRFSDNSNCEKKKTTYGVLRVSVPSDDWRETTAQPRSKDLNSTSEFQFTHTRWTNQ